MLLDLMKKFINKRELDIIRMVINLKGFIYGSLVMLILLLLVFLGIVIVSIMYLNRIFSSRFSFFREIFLYWDVIIFCCVVLSFFFSFVIIFLNVFWKGKWKIFYFLNI